MIEINLLPVDEEAAPRLKAAQKGLGFEVPKFIPRGFAAAVLALVAMYALSNLRASSYSKNLTGTKHTLADLRECSQQAQSYEARLPSLRERANIFRTTVESRKLWSKLLREIVLSCPGEAQLTEIKLGVPRSGTAGPQRVKELLIKGFYPIGGETGNKETEFRERLNRSQSIAAYYHNFVAMTDPQPGRTDFTIRCTEQ